MRTDGFPSRPLANIYFFGDDVFAGTGPLGFESVLLGAGAALLPCLLLWYAELLGLSWLLRLFAAALDDPPLRFPIGVVLSPRFVG